MNETHCVLSQLYLIILAGLYAVKLPIIISQNRKSFSDNFLAILKEVPHEKLIHREQIMKMKANMYFVKQNIGKSLMNYTC